MLTAYVQQATKATCFKKNMLPFCPLIVKILSKLKFATALNVRSQDNLFNCHGDLFRLLNNHFLGYHALDGIPLNDKQPS